MSGPARGRRRRARSLRAVSPCLALVLALVALDVRFAQAQTLTTALLRPVRDGFVSPQESPLRRTSEQTGDVTSGTTGDAANGAGLRDKDTPAPSRIGNIPTYGLPAASGASTSGFDSLNRTRKKPKYHPGQARPKPPPGPGSRAPVVSTGPVRLSIPPSDSANKTPIPPAMAGTVAGQPPRKRLRIDDDPFGAVGDYAGGFLVKSAIELGGGYDTNPRRSAAAKGSPFYVVAPEFLAVSDWERHAVFADLRVSTDNPGSPNIQAGLARYPVYATIGSTVGVDQNFNRLQLSVGGTVERTVYTDSKLTDGASTSNDDRNFNQFGGVGRLSYDLTPGVKPFAEIEGDRRVLAVKFDRSGFVRDSSGGYVKAGSSFEFSRLLTGEISLGYAARDYVDPRLNRLEGLLVASSLTWTATPLTTAKFYSTTSIDETTLPGVSGVLTHTYTVEADHDFRRWLTAIGIFTWGSLDYQGDGRRDKIYTVSGDLI